MYEYVGVSIHKLHYLLFQYISPFKKINSKYFINHLIYIIHKYTPLRMLKLNYTLMVSITFDSAKYSIIDDEERS